MWQVNMFCKIFIITILLAIVMVAMVLAKEDFDFEVWSNTNNCKALRGICLTWDMVGIGD